MAETDSPLKLLLSASITEFAEWLLKAKVLKVTSQNIELLPPTEVLRTDQVFQVTVADGQVAILHIEFQGRSSRRPMPLRQLEYLVRLTSEYPNLAVHSVVVYVGQGAGKDDEGSHAFYRLDGKAVISWYYDVLRLWEMTAEELLALDKPTLLGLVGQTKVTDPAKVVPLIVAGLEKITDTEKRGRILTAMLALINEEEFFAMLEQKFVEEELFTNTPYMIRMRKMEAEEERRAQEEQRRAQEEERRIQEERKEERKETTLATLQKSILRILQMRFTPPEAVLGQLETALGQVANEEPLQTLFEVALKADSISTFQAALAQLSAQAPT